MAEGTPILEIRDLNVYYGQSHALQGVDMVLHSGVHSVVGRNGMGKSTLCKAIMGLEPVASGTIAFNGQALNGRSPAEIARMGAADIGQACVVQRGQIIAREGPAGTDAMLAGLTQAEAQGAVLVKAPKPQQDRRADLPMIGPGTARAAVQAGLAGIVIEAGGVMVLDLPQVQDTLARAGQFLWVRA